MRKWTTQMEMLRHKKAQLSVLYEKKIASLRSATALSTRMREELRKEVRRRRRRHEDGQGVGVGAFRRLLTH